jgi:hypothetical protein
MLNLIVAIFTSVLASSGIWTLILKRGEKNDKKTRLLLGLAHDRIIYVGKSYIEKGWVSYDEYEDFMTYLYGPYSGFGGNGLAEKVKKEVGNLPMHHARSIDLEVEK